MDKNIYFVDLEYEDALVSFFSFKAYNDSRDIGFNRWHQHIFYELHFTFEKAVVCRFKDNEILLSPGEFVIIPPSVLHESVVYDSKAENYRVLSVEIKNIGEGKTFYDSFMGGLEAIALKPLKISDIKKESIISFDRKELYSSVLGICELKMYAAQVMHMLMKKTSQNRSVSSDANKAKVLIDTLISVPGISLGEIADSVNYSKRQVSRLIKEQYGESFSSIQKRMKNNEKNNIS